MGLLKRDQLGKYEFWIGETADDVYRSVIMAGGWQMVFPGPLPRWASRIRQYFNLHPFVLRLLDAAESEEHLRQAQTALGASARAKARRKVLQSRGMGISAFDTGNSMKPGTRFQPNPDPLAAIDGAADNVGTALALSGDVYEDLHTRTIWFQTNPGGAIYHTGRAVTSPALQAAGATYRGQEQSPVFKLICPDGTGGSREACVTNPFDVEAEPRAKFDARPPKMVGRATIGAVGEAVDVSKRFVTDSVLQGSYNYAETVQKGLPAHQRLDVHTDPMTPFYFVEPPDLFRLTMLGLRERPFPRNDPQGKPLAEQDWPAP